MNPLPYIDIHTHSDRTSQDTITVKNIFPGEGFAAFRGRNFYSAGLHPWHLKSPEENNQLLVMVEDALEFDHVIFVGECGLDKIAETDFEEQKRIFAAQAFMAEEFGYPLIIHCVKAFGEVMELHKKMKPVMPWIMHGYNGNLQQTLQMENKNFLFSFGDNLLKPGSKAIQSFKHLSPEKIFFETDESETSVAHIYSRGATLKQINHDRLKETVLANFNRIEKTLTDSEAEN